MILSSLKVYLSLSCLSRPPYRTFLSLLPSSPASHVSKKDPLVLSTSMTVYLPLLSLPSSLFILFSFSSLLPFLHSYGSVCRPCLIFIPVCSLFMTLPSLKASTSLVSTILSSFSPPSLLLSLQFFCKLHGEVLYRLCQSEDSVISAIMTAIFAGIRSLLSS